MNGVITQYFFDYLNSIKQYADCDAHIWSWYFYHHNVLNLDNILVANKSEELK